MINTIVEMLSIMGLAKAESVGFCKLDSLFVVRTKIHFAEETMRIFTIEEERYEKKKELSFLEIMRYAVTLSGIHIYECFVSIRTDSGNQTLGK